MYQDADVMRQEDFERKQISGGLEKLREQTRNLESKDYASATCYGAASIDNLLPHFIEAVEEKKKERSKFKAASHENKALQHILSIDTESACAITLKIVFDKVFSYRKKNSTVVSVTESIGKAIEAELQLRYYEKEAPGLFTYLKNTYWHQSRGTEYKRKQMQTCFNRSDVDQWKHWPINVQIQIGTWFVNLLCESSGWFTKFTEFKGKKRCNYIYPTEEFFKFKDKIVKKTELFSPFSWPMIIEPRPWGAIESGGYYLNDLTRCHEMVRRGVDSSIQGKKTREFLNKIQKVQYRLNPFTVSIAEILERQEHEVGKFKPIIHLEEPPKPLDIDTNKEALDAWKREANRIHTKNVNSFRVSCRTRMTLNVMKEFKDKVYWIPWSFDYRGRTYPIPSFLTPQSDDFGKSLIRFARESEITEDGKQWLAFHVATTYGLDKATMDERKAWPFIPENAALIKRVATDPIGNIGDWENADEPWQFAAACEEFYAVVVTNSRSTTGLPVATDATCSGMQVLAGLARDKSTASMVNVIPNDKPQDAYKVIADKALPNIPERLRPYWDRKCTKRTVMTIPYNAKPFSNRSYIREALKDKGLEIDQEELTQTVQAVRDAMEEIFPGPMRVMRWIEKEVSRALKNGATELSWVTPSGFRVTQRLMKMNVKRLNLQLLGRCQISVPSGERCVDASHHKNATAPNLIHSLDASLLHISATKFNPPIALIHDSVLCRATDMSNLSHLVRDTYMHLFAEHDYLSTFAESIGAETEPPMVDTLKPESVIESTYFFC